MCRRSKKAIKSLFIKCCVSIILVVSGYPCIAQGTDKVKPAKVLHAEPLYIDLIRDLGARKGEKEWNYAVGITDKLDFDQYEALVEYEFAPIDKLGFEIETPFLFYTPNSETTGIRPANKMEGIQLATQWTFLVSEKKGLSMALGYLNLFEFSDFDQFGDPLINGNVYNPFLVIAKRLGSNFHSMVYTGPAIEKSKYKARAETVFEINTSFHYMIPSSGNFIGVELNKEITDGDFDMVIRPQMRLEISDDFLIGIVAGIPISKADERMSSFLRLIWEP